METHTHTGHRQFLAVGAVICLLIAVGCAAMAIAFWRLWSPTNDGQLGLAMFSLGAICATALRDFWEGSELVLVDEPLQEVDEPLEAVVERAADRSANDTH